MAERGPAMSVSHFISFPGSSSAEAIRNLKRMRTASNTSSTPAKE
jgi:hypothetical protein